MTKPTKWHVRPAKTQISLGIRPVWSESSLCAWRKLGSLATHWVQSEDSDQTGRMPRLIWVFAGRHFVGFVVSRLRYAFFAFLLDNNDVNKLTPEVSGFNRNWIGFRWVISSHFVYFPLCLLPFSLFPFRLLSHFVYSHFVYCPIPPTPISFTQADLMEIRYLVDPWKYGI